MEDSPYENITREKAIEYLVEAKDFITEVEDELYKTNKDATSKLETAWVEIDIAIAYLQGEK